MVSVRARRSRSRRARCGVRRPRATGRHATRRKSRGYGKMRPVPSSSRLVQGLARSIGPGNVLVEPDEVAPYVQDWRGAFRGAARAVACPGSTGECADVVRLCAAAGVPIVPQGGNTGMCGGAIPDETASAVVVAL